MLNRCASPSHVAWVRLRGVPSGGGHGCQVEGSIGQAGQHSQRGTRRIGPVRQVPVDRIRPEEGLGRKRNRVGHQELCRSIAQFGVLTPITVRPTNDGTEDYLLVKGQGRTLACRLLGISRIPAIVEESISESEKVQQFLVENVARLRMKPADRALLIANARAAGEETSSVAKRFGISAATVRRLAAQLGDASDVEIAALRRGDVSLAVQAVIAQRVPLEERQAIIEALAGLRVSAKDLEGVLLAIGWTRLVSLGSRSSRSRQELLRWFCVSLVSLPRGSLRERIGVVAGRMPVTLDESAGGSKVAV